jgi:hypothetical protein
MATGSGRERMTSCKTPERAFYLSRAVSLARGLGAHAESLKRLPPVSPHWHDPIIGARVPAVTSFKATEIPGVAPENWSLVIAVYAVPAPPKAIIVLNMTIGVPVPHVMVAVGCRLGRYRTAQD